mgnify:CR=1 FL=1
MARKLRSSMGVAACCAWAILAGFCHAADESQQGDDGGKFDGAVWQFTMKPKTGNAKAMRGRFRVNQDVIYQKATPADPTFSKKIGMNHPRYPKTKIEVTDLRALDEAGKLHRQIKGTAHLSIDKRGEWSGEFVDADGVHWEFQCTRTQE